MYLKLLHTHKTKCREYLTRPAGRRRIFISIIATCASAGPEIALRCRFAHWPNVYIYVSLYALGCGLVDLRLSLPRVMLSVCVCGEPQERKKTTTQVGSSNYPKALSIIKIITHAKILIAAAPCHSLAFWALQFAWNNLSFFLHTPSPTWAWRNFHHGPPLVEN